MHAFVVLGLVFPYQAKRLATEKLNPTPQKHAFTNQNKCTTTQYKHKKTKARNDLFCVEWGVKP